MREILYRSKRFDNGEWVYGSLVQMLVDGRIATCICPIEEVGKANKDVPQMGILYTLNEDIFIVDPATIGEYTGLTDKNDNKIFEGDVVKCNNKVEEYIGIVDWDMCNPSMCIRYKTKRGFDDVEYDFIIGGNMTIEVLGNIHDNPSLLKGGEE